MDDLEQLRSLLDSAQSGDSSAFERLLKLYKPLIDRHCIVNGAFDEDCKQQILIQIYIKTQKFDDII